MKICNLNTNSMTPKTSTAPAESPTSDSSRPLSPYRKNPTLQIATTTVLSVSNWEIYIGRTLLVRFPLTKFSLRGRGKRIWYNQLRGTYSLSSTLKIEPWNSRKRNSYSNDSKINFKDPRTCFFIVCITCSLILLMNSSRVELEWEWSETDQL